MHNDDPISADILQTHRLTLKRQAHDRGSVDASGPCEAWTIIEKRSLAEVGRIDVGAKRVWVEIHADLRRQGFGTEALTAAIVQLDTPETINMEVPESAHALVSGLGFRQSDKKGIFTGPTHRQAKSIWLDHAERYHAAYAQQLEALHADLDLPPDYGATHQLSPVPEAMLLNYVGQDLFDRPQHLSPSAAEAWRQLAASAQEDGQILHAVSGYRSVRYQTAIIRRKLDSGQSVAEILRVSAAPGFSEHHSGDALDVADETTEPLSELFEQSSAFYWLQQNADRFGFQLSYPRNNIHGLAYEPWHWRFNAELL